MRSISEDEAEDYRRQDREERYDRDRERYPAPDKDCSCGNGDWEATIETEYGSDLDGNRGVPLIVFECSACGQEREVVYA